MHLSVQHLNPGGWINLPGKSIFLICFFVPMVQLLRMNNKHHGKMGKCLKSIFLADCPHTKPPWLFLLGWYPLGFMMLCKYN